MHSRLQAIYRIRCDARSIDARAGTLAVEQSVEMPLTAISDDFVLTEIVGRVESIREVSPGLFEVAISLATATVGDDPGQLLNMLFGNSSLHDDVVLWDVDLPPALSASLGGPRHGLQGLRARAGAARARSPARRSSRRGCRRPLLPISPPASRRAASTTSRTITASPIRPIRRSPSG